MIRMAARRAFLSNLLSLTCNTTCRFRSFVYYLTLVNQIGIGVGVTLSDGFSIDFLLVCLSLTDILR